ncbi:MAG: peptidase E [Rickettsiales bacterium]|jgi:dipeptidase E|nr:peptidase E [Rickettsiales bacterium]
MKAILTSTNITKIKGGVDLAAEMTGKPASAVNIAVINEASAMEFGDHRFVIDDLKDLAGSFGGAIEIVHLLALPLEKIRERILAADMLFATGGNTEWLKVVFDKSGLSKILPEILECKLYVGSSAGSMILGRMPSYENQDAMYGKADHFGVESYLDLLDFLILPHFRAEYLNDRSDDWAVNESKSAGLPVYAISDSAGVAVDGEKIFLVGDGGYRISGGKIPGP